MTTVIHATDENVESLIKSKGRVIVKFGAEWCRPCKSMMPIVKEVAEAAAGRVSVIDVDTEESPDVTAKFRVKGLPTFVLMEGERELNRHTGTMSKARLMDWVKE